METVIVRMPEKLKRAIEKEAKRADMSMAAWIRVHLRSRLVEIGAVQWSSKEDGKAPTVRP